MIVSQDKMDVNKLGLLFSSLLKDILNIGENNTDLIAIPSKMLLYITKETLNSLESKALGDRGVYGIVLRWSYYGSRRTP